MRERGWTEQEIPSQEGRIFLVTGANGGLGYETARVLAQRGARVILACRRPDAAADAARRLRECAPQARVEVEALDLADLRSVEECAARVGETAGRLDGLVNNAGLMGAPRAPTADGFERQLGVNHLGHFALTGRLLPCLLAAPAPRVVTVTSETARFGRINFDDLQGDRHYRRWRAYAQAKLANLLFAVELERRARAAGSALVSLAAHPGYAGTGLQVSRERRLRPPVQRFWNWANRAVAQGAAAGAWPTLRAATDPAARGGALYGPSRLLAGPAVLVRPYRRATDQEAARRLWEASEALTGVRYPF